MSATKFRPVSLIYFTAIVSVLFLELTRHNNGDDPEDLEEREGMIRLSPPTLDDEEQNSPHIPKALRCDGCRTVAYQVKVHRDGGGGGCGLSHIILCAYVGLVIIHFPTSHFCSGLVVVAQLALGNNLSQCFLQRVDTCI